MHRVMIAAVAAVAALIVAVLPAKAGLNVSIDKSSQSMTVSVDGGPTYHWPVSTGRGGYDTPAGDFRAIRLERVYYSKKYDDAPMPNSVFFYGGYAIHGTYEESRLGRPASHGCVRLARANAALLYELVRAHGMSNTRISIGGSARDSAPVARSYEPRRERAWAQPDYGAARYDNWAPDSYRPRQTRRAEPRYAEQPRFEQRRIYSDAPPRIVRYGRGFDPYDRVGTRTMSEAEFRAFERRGWR